MEKVTINSVHLTIPNEDSQMTLDRLPPEIINKIFTHLKFPPDLQATNQTCRRFQEIINSDQYLANRRDCTPEQILKEDPMALLAFPNQAKTYDRCLKFVQKNHKVFQFVPIKHKRPIIEELGNSRFGNSSLNRILEEDPMALQFFSYEAKTYERCLQSVQKDSNSFRFVPIKHHTQTLRNIVIHQNNPQALKLIILGKIIHCIDGILCFNSILSLIAMIVLGFIALVLPSALVGFITLSMFGLFLLFLLIGCLSCVNYGFYCFSS